MQGDRLENLERYGERGWEWETVEEHWHTGREIRRAYRTDSGGTGLWLECYNAYGSYEGWRQQRGTSQFSLPASRSSARRKLLRELAEVTL